MQNNQTHGKLYVIGIGPGAEDQMTFHARDSLQKCDAIIGYDTYVDLIAHLLSPSQEVIRAGMTEEVYRAQRAVELAASGKVVGVISSGDSGLYGMAGLIYEVIHKMNISDKIDIEVVPGITALISAASLLGAPAMHDFCAISLSDHLTPWKTIAERLAYAGLGDFIIALYNPKSSRRKEQLSQAREILMQYRSPQNPVGIVTSAYRPDQSVIITDLEHMTDFPVGMMTTIIIGNSTTGVVDGKMITPRGYEKKYRLDNADQPLPRTERMNPKNEPWAMKNTSDERPGSPVLLKPVTELLHGSLHKYYIKTLGNINQTVADSERILNIKFLMILNPFLTDDSRIQTTSDGRLILVCHEVDGETKQKLHDAGLYLYDEEEFIVIKKCNFCEGDKIQSLPWLDKLNRELSDVSVPGLLHIGFNGCGMSCHGAVMEDIGIVYFRGEYEVYVGGKKMGRSVRLPLHVHKNLSGESMIAVVQNIVERYKAEAMPGEKFFKYIGRVNGDGADQ